MGPTKIRFFDSIHRIRHQIPLIFDPNLTRKSFFQNSRVILAQWDSRRAVMAFQLLLAGHVTILFKHNFIKTIIHFDAPFTGLFLFF